jgi:hypothetical protein
MPDRGGLKQEVGVCANPFPLLFVLLFMCCGSTRVGNTMHATAHACHHTVVTNIV